MLENIAFFSNKKGKNHLIVNIESEGGENLFRVPTLLSGIVAGVSFHVTPHLKLRVLHNKLVLYSIVL